MFHKIKVLFFILIACFWFRRLKFFYVEHFIKYAYDEYRKISILKCYFGYLCSCPFLKINCCFQN